MRCLFLSLIVIIGFSAQGHAQELDISAEPLCFQVRNTQDFTMYGTIRTDFYPTDSGTMARHTSNYRLEAAGSLDRNGYPADRAEFCSYGPFHDGRKLELNIKTLFPVFSCKTRLDQGEILLMAERNAEDTGYRYWAECFE